MSCDYLCTFPLHRMFILCLVHNVFFAGKCHSNMWSVLGAKSFKESLSRSCGCIHVLTLWCL